MPAYTAPVGAAADSYVSELIGQAAGDNKEAFTKLDAMFRPRVGEFLYRACGDHWLTDDLTNETFLRAYQSLTNFRGHGQRQFRSFLLTIAINLLRDHFRQRRGAAVSFSQCSMEEPQAEGSKYRGDNRAEAEERRTMLREALGCLRPDETILISLSHIKDLPAEQVAVILGKPSAQAVRAGLCRAMKHLRAVLKRQGYFTQLPA